MGREPVRLVVDSSVAVKWLLAEREPDVDVALRLLDRHKEGLVRLTAPAFLLLEVLNAVRKRGSGVEVMRSSAQSLLAARLDLAAIEPLAARAAVIAVEHDLTVYDATFAALAESLDAELVTADRRLAACTACRTRLLQDT